ncbi:mCG1038721 [Mus musculus]|nr:mCG1038721 [Mus musculus]
MCAEGSCSSVVLPGLLSARKPGKRNIFRHE